MLHCIPLIFFITYFNLFLSVFIIFDNLQFSDQKKSFSYSELYSCFPENRVTITRSKRTWHPTSKTFLGLATCEYTRETTYIKIKLFLLFIYSIFVSVRIHFSIDIRYILLTSSSLFQRCRFKITFDLFTFYIEKF